MEVRRDISTGLYSGDGGPDLRTGDGQLARGEYVRPCLLYNLAEPMTAFAELLRDYLRRLEERRRLSVSEDTIRDAFLDFLRRAFPRLEEAEPILLEHYLPGIKVRSGFADALFGDLIFEFKRRLDEAHRAEGRKELERYILSRPEPERFSGILTDGDALEVYVIRDGRLSRDPVDRLKLSEAGADAAKLWLDSYLFHERRVPPTAEDVARRFGERSPAFRESLRLLRRLWAALGARPEVRTRFAEWQSLLAIVYGSPVGDAELFLRHTYLALFARLLAFTALRRRAPTRDELLGVVRGEAFEALGLGNFAEDDFFAWVAVPDGPAEWVQLPEGLSLRLAAAYDLRVAAAQRLRISPDGPSGGPGRPAIFGCGPPAGGPEGRAVGRGPASPFGSG